MSLVRSLLTVFVRCVAEFVIYVTLGITTWGSLNVDSSTEWVTYFTVRYKKTKTLDKWHDVTASTGLPQVTDVLVKGVISF